MAVASAAVFACTGVKNPPAVPHYPYLPMGEEVYRDRHPIQVGPKTTLREIYEASHFAGLPEFIAAKKEEGWIKEEESEFRVEGDGGFSGMRLVKPKEFPAALIVLFPDQLGGERMYTLVRRADGWRVKR